MMQDLFLKLSKLNRKPSVTLFNNLIKSYKFSDYKLVDEKILIEIQQYASQNNIIYSKETWDLLYKLTGNSTYLENSLEYLL